MLNDIRVLAENQLGSTDVERKCEAQYVLKVIEQVCGIDALFSEGNRELYDTILRQLAVMTRSWEE